jgi:7-carboxy-7-deazaguanine synthase
VKYKVVEIFESINGEGMKAGELAVFIRFQGCNLCCSYCDTMWANEPDAPYMEMELAEIVETVRNYAVRNVTVTGGEPLRQKEIKALLAALDKEGFAVEIETNGSVALAEYAKDLPEVCFTMDYKLPGSGMEQQMETGNFAVLTKKDTVKFVVSSRSDLERAYEVAERYQLGGRCSILLSPVFGAIEPEEIVSFMKEKRWVDARIQIQLHKVIWNPQERGV